MSDLSLEKLKISERLRDLELSVTAHMSRVDEVILNQGKIVACHAKLLFGNGEKGLMREVDSLKIFQRKTSKMFWALWGVVSVIVSGTAVGLIIHYVT